MAPFTGAYDGDGHISGCSMSGQVRGANNVVGGIVGFNRGDITDCYATGDSSSTNPGVGGLVGVNTRRTITRCHASRECPAPGNSRSDRDGCCQRAPRSAHRRG